jgi:hypothetical protein
MPGKFFQVSPGYPTNPAVGTQSPLRNNALMFNGGTDLTVSSPTSGNGGFRVPGTVTSFRVAVNSVTNPDGSTTTTKYSNLFTYQINYDAILYWIKNNPNNPFPAQLRAGGILYYSSIPTHIDTTTFPLPTTTQAQCDARFWKEYIDEVLGVQQTGFSSTNGATYAVYSNIAGRTGYGDYFTWPGKKTAIYTSGRGLEGLSSPVSGPTTGWNNTFNPASSSFDSRYLDYRDNPVRPRLEFWFGPMTFVDFVSNINRGRAWLPGTCHEAPMWQCKRGVVAALNDIKFNHPNDLVTLIAFSQPTGYSPSLGSNLLAGTYNTVRSPLGRNYNAMTNALYFPTYVSQTTNEITPYDPNNSDVPRAIGGTCPAMGLMLAYNQYSRGSTSTDLLNFAGTPAPPGQAGGLGRAGAQKLVILETDGVASSTVYAPGSMNSIFQDNGPYKSYFKVRYDTLGSNKNEYPPYIANGYAAGTNGSNEAANQAIEVATRLCASDQGSNSGYTTSRKPVRIHCMAFGSLFNSPMGANGQTALNLLQQLQTIGGVQSDPTTPLDPSKIITGTSQQRISNMQTAFSNIMQDGYSVTLIN